MPGAYGAHGGIAQYNRDLFAAITAAQSNDQVMILPRRAKKTCLDPIPHHVRQFETPTSRLSYVMRALQIAASQPATNIVFCGHLRLAGLAACIASFCRAGLWLQVHGIEAWGRLSWLVRNVMGKADLVTAVSRFTRDKVLGQWASCDPCKIKVLPNTIRSEFSPGSKSVPLLERYNLRGRRVLLSVSRLAKEERYKGHDRVIAALPRLRATDPDLIYLIVGRGDDLERLRNLTLQVGQEDHVCFAGDVPAQELPNFYRTADVFVMPSTGEGFGIVFLEAAACGLPVVGGNLDGSWDALREGHLGFAIDPLSEDELVSAIVRALTSGPTNRHLEVGAFGRQNFQAHVDSLLNRFFPTPDIGPSTTRHT